MLTAAVPPRRSLLLPGLVWRALLLLLLSSSWACKDQPQGPASPSPSTGQSQSANVPQPPPTEIRVLTDRTASHLQRLFDEYNRATGNKVIANFVDEGLLARLENRPQEADLVITKNAAVMEQAKRRKLLARYVSPEIDTNVPAELGDPDRHYAVISYRARLIFYSKDRVRPEELSTYADLANPKWKGRICLRSGFHEYNLSLFSQLAATDGMESVTALLKGLDANLARKPQGDDRAQVRAIMEKVCDVALANSYYMGIMLANEDQRAWGEAAHVFFPKHGKDGARGTLVMRSAAGLTTSTARVGEATKLLAFLTGDYAQTYFANALLEYPVKKGVPIASVNRQLGSEQGLANGVFDMDVVPLAKTVDFRQPIVAALQQLDFDRAR